MNDGVIYNIDLLYDFLEENKQTGIVSAVIDIYHSEKPIWNDLTKAIDLYLRSNYKFRNLLPYFIFESSDNTLSTFNKILYAVDAILLANDYKYRTLYGTLNLEYNPIENYNMTETETINGNESGTVKTDFGAKTDTVTENYGERQKTNIENMGARMDDTTVVNGERFTTQSVNIGKQKNTKTTNSGTIENTLSVSPSDEANTFYGKEKNVETQTKDGDVTDLLGEKTDTTTTTDNTYTDTTTVNVGATTNDFSETDSAFVNSQTIENGEKSDNETRNLTHTETRSLSRSGNIGVTTSQRMVESERQVAMFSLIDLIASDVVNAISLSVWGCL